MSPLKGGYFIENFCLQRLIFFILILSIIINSSSLLASLALLETKAPLNINVSKFPYIYTKLTTKDYKASISEIKSDGERITDYEFRKIGNSENNKLIPILLIQNNGDILVDSYDVKMMNFLLFLKDSLPEKENSIAFTFASELNQVKRSILTINFNEDSNVRLYDSLIVLPNFLGNIKGYPFIILIGTGENRGGISDRFLPRYPIVFIDIEDNCETKTDLQEFVKMSGGFSTNLSDVKDYYQIEENIKRELNSTSLITAFKAPFRFSFVRNHSVSIKLTNGEEFFSIYRIGGITIIFPWLITLFSLFITSYSLYYLMRKRWSYGKRENVLSPIYLGLLEINLKSGVKNFLIPKGELIIGSGEECDLKIDDFEISALHCIIKRRKDIFEIVDLNSRNGTYVNCSKVSSKILENGDVIRIGSTTMIFKCNKIVENENV